MFTNNIDLYSPIIHSYDDNLVIARWPGHHELASSGPGCIDNVWWQVVPVINDSNRKVITSNQSLNMGLK